MFSRPSPPFYDCKPVGFFTRNSGLLSGLNKTSIWWGCGYVMGVVLRGGEEEVTVHMLSIVFCTASG